MNFDWLIFNQKSLERDHFIELHWLCTLIYRPLSYPLRPQIKNSTWKSAACTLRPWLFTRNLFLLAAPVGPLPPVLPLLPPFPAPLRGPVALRRRALLLREDTLRVTPTDWAPKRIILYYRTSYM